MEEEIIVLDILGTKELKEKYEAKFIKEIKLNNALLFQLNDSKYLLQPIYPLGKSIVFINKDSLNEWINKDFFPTGEVSNNLLNIKKSEVDKLVKGKYDMKIVLDSLQNYLPFMNKDFSSQEIDQLYKTLVKSNKLKERKLDFILFVSWNIINKCNNLNIRYGILKQNLYLNATYEIVLIDDDDKVYKLQNKIFGKHKYPNFDYLKNTLYLTSKIKEYESFEIFDFTRSAKSE